MTGAAAAISGSDLDAAVGVGLEVAVDRRGSSSAASTARAAAGRGRTSCADRRRASPGWRCARPSAARGRCPGVAKKIRNTSTLRASRTATVDARRRSTKRIMPVPYVRPAGGPTPTCRRSRRRGRRGSSPRGSMASRRPVADHVEDDDRHRQDQTGRDRDPRPGVELALPVGDHRAPARAAAPARRSRGTTARTRSRCPSRSCSGRNTMTVGTTLGSSSPRR